MWGPDTKLDFISGIETPFCYCEIKEEHAWSKKEISFPGDTLLCSAASH